MVKRLVAAALCACMVGMSGCSGSLFAEPGTMVVELPQAVIDTGDFSTLLLQLADDGSKNVVLSPLSAYVALAMAAEGAAGNTRAQFEQVLGGGIEEISAGMEALSGYLADTRGSTEWKLAQSVWIQDGIPFAEDYINILGGSYDADIFSGDLSENAMRDAINGWAAEQTNGLIDPFLSQNLPEDSVMALLNALYFKGKWQTAFDENTFTGDFQNFDGSQGEAEYMTAGGIFKVIDTGNVRGVVLPYDDGKTQMVVLMPEEDAVLPAAMLGELGAGEMAALAQAAEEKMVELRLPAFTVESRYDLADSLKEMGLTDAFEAEVANFLKMSDQPGLHLSMVQQAVCLTVDTQGTEAAAVTMGVMEKESAVEYQSVLHFDRPFAYAVIDTQTQIPLFIGTYNTAE